MANMNGQTTRHGHSSYEPYAEDDSIITVTEVELDMLADAIEHVMDGINMDDDERKILQAAFDLVQEIEIR